MAVLDIRGTHGSGKSWVMHQLLARYSHEPIIEDGEHLGYCLQPIDAAIIGKYKTVCGGCDGIGTADEVVRRVRLFAGQHRHVLLEGILVAHTFRRYYDLAVEVGNYHFLFLNTPLGNCIARTRARRRAKGNVKPLNTANLIKDWHQIWERTRAKCIAARCEVIVLDWRDPMSRVLEELDNNALG